MVSIIGCQSSYAGAAARNLRPLKVDWTPMTRRMEKRAMVTAGIGLAILLVGAIGKALGWW